MMSRPTLVVPAIALAAGAVSSFLGIGGGAIIVPLLMITVGLSFKEAVGTSLAAVVLISTVGVVSTLAVDASNVAWTLAAVLTAGSLTGSLIGGRVVARVPDRALRLGFAVLLVVAGWRLVAAPAADAHGALALGLIATPIHAVVFVIGFAAGVTSVLFGLGGGVLIVPALLVAFPEAPFRTVAATSLVTVIPTSVLSLVPHARLGTINRRLVSRLAPVGIVSAIGGACAVNVMPAWPCRIAFAVFLAFVVSRLVVGHGASTVGEPTTDALANLTAMAARLHVLPGDTLCQVHRLATIRFALLERQAATPTS
jgi:uncharacterized membrane protein YfcA